MANVLPWEQEKVGPGLGLGYTTDGADGFNSGMMDRQAWAPPTVDDLRTVSNPKVTYELDSHQGPAQSKVQNRGSIGEFEKHGPTTDFALGPQYWTTGTGSTLAPMQNSQQMMTDENRASTSCQYYGTSSTGADGKTYVKGEYEASQRPEFCSPGLNPVAAGGKGSGSGDDYGASGYNIAKNNRLVSCESRNNGLLGGINGTFKAVMAPVMDALRPSRKENLIQNTSSLGIAQSAVPNLPITNPADRVPTTIKETTVDKAGLNYLNVSQMSAPEGGYQSTEVQVKDQERNHGNYSSNGYVGNTSVTSNEMSRTAAYNQHNNVNRTYQNWPMAGGTSMFNGQENIQVAKMGKDRVNNRLTCNDFIQQPPLDATIPSAETYGKINMPQQYGQQVNSDRMNPHILSAFKSNPYAQSLQSY